MKLLRPLIIPLFTLAACSSGGASEASGDTTSGGEGHVAAAVALQAPPRPTDLSPVAEPSGHLATIRCGSMSTTFGAFGRLFGDPDEAEATVTRARNSETGSDALAALVDTNGGFESAFILVEDEPESVFAFRGPSMAAAAAGIPMAFHPEARADGSIYVPKGEGETARTRACSIEPAADAEHTRIVCASSDIALEASRQYLGRNFATPAPDNVVQFSVALDSLRAAWGATAHGGITLGATALESTLSEAENPILRNPAVVAAIVRLARDFLDDISSLVDEVSGIDATLTVMGDQLDVDANITITNASGSLTRALGETLSNGSAVSEDLVRNLPPGAVAYGAGHWNGRPFDDFVTEARDVVSALVRAGIQLSQGDIDALERGLAYAFRSTSYDFGVASGFDANVQPWTVVSARYANAAEATQAIDAMRQMVAVFRRPTVARAIDALFEDLGDDRPRFAQITEVRTNGLPRGSYAVRMPPFEILATRFLTARLGVDAPAQTPAPAMRETLVVPNGADLTVVQSVSAVSVYRGLATAGGIAPEIRAALLTPGASMNLVMRLGNIRMPNQPVDDDAGAPTFESVIGVEAGQALTLIRMSNSGSGSNLRFELDSRIEGVLLRGLAHANTQRRAE